MNNTTPDGSSWAESRTTFDLSGSAFVGVTQWLDLLPVEIIEQIAAHYSHGAVGLNSARLARLSNKLRDAVCSTLPNPALLEFPCEGDSADKSEAAVLEPLQNNNAILVECARAFGEHPIHLNCRSLTGFVREVLQERNVTQCSIEGDHELLKAVSKKTSVRILTIDLSARSRITEVFRLLCTMTLTEIHFRGYVDCGKDLNSFTDGCNKVVLSSPELKMISLRHLRVRTRSDFLEWREQQVIIRQAFYNAITKLPECCEVSVRMEPPEDNVPLFRKFRSVQAYDISTNAVSQIGNAASFYSANLRKCSLSDDDEPRMKFLPRIAPKDLDVLNKCRNITELHMHLEMKLFCHLPNVLVQLHNLNDLGMRLSCTRYERIPPGMLLQIAKATPMLSSLHLQDVLVAPWEWEHVLEQLGGRLRNLEFYRDIALSPLDLKLDRLEAQLRSILKFCPNMRSFSPSEILLSTCILDIECNTAYLENRAKTLGALAARIQVTQPYLNRGSLQRVVEDSCCACMPWVKSGTTVTALFNQM